MVPMSLPVNFTNIAKLQTTTNNYNNNAALNELNVLEAWKAGYTGSGTRIGIYDQTLGFSSITAKHEFLNFTLSESAERDAHGFKVAQYATAQNHMPASVFGSGEKTEAGSSQARDVTGVAFDAQLFIADESVEAAYGYGREESWHFHWLAEQNVDVINWSGTPKIGDERSQNALRIANENGIIVVIAAGNEAMGMDEGRSQDTLRFASQYDNIIVTGASGPYDQNLASYSNHAGDVEHNFFTTMLDSSHGYFPSGEYEQPMYGTSGAAPYIAGAVALIIQKLRTEGRYDYDGDYRQVINALKQSSTISDTTDAQFWSGGGRVLDSQGLTLIVNAFGTTKLLDGLTETVTDSSHTIEYNGTTFDYSEVDGMITTVVRDGEFTSEFAAEIAESFPNSAGISYSTAVALIGQANMESTLMMVAGADGNYVG